MGENTYVVEIEKIVNPQEMLDDIFCTQQRLKDAKLDFDRMTSRIAVNSYIDRVGFPVDSRERAIAEIHEVKNEIREYERKLEELEALSCIEFVYQVTAKGHGIDESYTEYSLETAQVKAKEFEQQCKSLKELYSSCGVVQQTVI